MASAFAARMFSCNGCVMLCPHCNEQASYLFTAQDRNRKKPGTFDYFHGPCGLVFIGEVPKNLADYYDGGYQHIPADEAQLAAAAAPERYRLTPIKQRVASGSFLEIGPWIGLTSYNAKQAGYDASVLEIDERCVSLLRSVGINAVQTDDPAAALARLDRSFDVIALWHSIEHLPRPWDVIREAARRLRPGGLLYVAAPNPESAQFRVFGKDWFHLDAPRHLYFLPAAMVEAIGAEEGLVTDERTTDDTLGKILDRDGWWAALHDHVPVPILRRAYKLAVGGILKARHRKKGDFAGAGYAVAMTKPLRVG